MGIWSSIRDFYHRWKPEIDLYGIGFLLLVSALITGRTAAAGIVFVLIVIWDIMRRWGEPWRQIGEKEMERRRRASQAIWQERFDSWFSHLQKEPPPHLEPDQQTRLIPSPTPDGEEPPESPAPIQESEKPASVIPPPVTHDT